MAARDSVAHELDPKPALAAVLHGAQLANALTGPESGRPRTRLISALAWRLVSG